MISLLIFLLARAEVFSFHWLSTNIVTNGYLPHYFNNPKFTCAIKTN